MKTVVCDFTVVVSFVRGQLCTSLYGVESWKICIKSCNRKEF
jgi:hypothetical protein